MLEVDCIPYPKAPPVINMQSMRTINVFHARQQDSELTKDPLVMHSKTITNYAKVKPSVSKTRYHTKHLQNTFKPP